MINILIVNYLCCYFI